MENRVIAGKDVHIRIECFLIILLLLYATNYGA